MLALASLTSGCGTPNQTVEPPTPDGAPTPTPDVQAPTPPADGLLSLDVNPEPGEPVRTVWLVRERELRTRPFNQGEVLSTLPFNSKVLILDKPDLYALEHQSMLQVYPVRVPTTGEQGWLSVDYEEAGAFREQAVTIDELQKVIEQVRVGLGEGRSVEYDKLGAEVLGLWGVTDRPAAFDQTPLIEDHLTLQSLRHSMAPDNLEAVCGMISALSLSRQTQQVAQLQAKASALAGDPLQRWLSPEHLAMLKDTQRAQAAATTDRELLEARVAYRDARQVLYDAALSDFDPLSNTWCTGSDTWVRAALPGLEVDSGEDLSLLDVPGNRYEAHIWFDRQWWTARAATTEGALDDDVLAFMGNYTSDAVMLVDDFDVGCLNLGHPQRHVMSILKKTDAFIAECEAVAQLMQGPRARLFEQIAGQQACEDERRYVSPSNNPVAEIEDILANVTLTAKERGILRRLKDELSPG